MSVMRQWFGFRLPIRVFSAGCFDVPGGIARRSTTTAGLLHVGPLLARLTPQVLLNPGVARVHDLGLRV